MTKLFTLLLLGISVMLLGYGGAGFLSSPAADPVPQELIVAHSNHCSGCHGHDLTGLSLIDAEGHDVNIFDDWQISMMAFAARDPFWRATVAHEVHLYPSAQEEIEGTCLRCHSSLGLRQALHNGEDYSFAKMLTDSLGLDGVSCGSCHQQPEERLGKFHSGHFLLDTNRIMFGPYPDPLVGPMQLYVGFEPVFGEHIFSSGICAGCHTLVTGTLDDSGTPTGNFFVEQATYHEWLNSVYPGQFTECQTCHMPFIADSVIIASSFQSLGKRHPFGLHQFFGANTLMLDLMRSNKDVLNLPETTHPDQDVAWEESISNNRKSLASAATIIVDSWYIEDDSLVVDFSVINHVGHKLPSGYPSRIAWLQVLLTDQDSGDTLYFNGKMDSEGHIIGRDLPFEPHHEICRAETDVQIYEMVMSNMHGQVTTRLNAAFEPVKDNRLLPRGFRLNHPVYDTTAIWGTALEDMDYKELSTAGRDRIQYRIGLTGTHEFGKLEIALLYQTLPPRFVADMFTRDTIQLVGAFKSMYEGYETFAETIIREEIGNIMLNTSAVANAPQTLQFQIFPNPVTGRTLHVEWQQYIPGHVSNLTYELVSIHGNVLQSGKLQHAITLHPAIVPGVFYFRMRDGHKLVGLKPVIIL